MSELSSTIIDFEGYVEKNEIFFQRAEVCDIYNNKINKLCSPLKKLGISYFSHAYMQMDKFYILNNHREFMNHYLRSEYYNADIHMAAENQFGQYVLWDALELTGTSRALYKDAAEFDIRHIFTIIKKNEGRCDFYHFGVSSVVKEINQIYLTNLELLNLFVFFFKENIKELPLNKIYKSVNLRHGNFMIKNSNNCHHINKNDFFREFGLKEADISILALTCSNKSLKKLTQRETECIYYYAQGCIAKDIAELLNISKRTVETYVMSAKEKLGISSKKELIKQALGKIS